MESPSAMLPPADVSCRNPARRGDGGRSRVGDVQPPMDAGFAQCPYGERDDVAPDPISSGTTPQGSGAGQAPQRRRHITWPSDNELHLLIETDRSPVLIDLSGTLDDRTGGALDPVIREVIDEGHLRFDLDIDHLDIVDPRGFDALSALRHSIVSAGGTLTRVYDHGPPQLEGPPPPSSGPRDGATSPRPGPTPALSGAIVGAGA